MHLKILGRVKLGTFLISFLYVLIITEIWAHSDEGKRTPSRPLLSKASSFPFPPHVIISK